MQLLPSHISRIRFAYICSALVVLIGGVYVYRAKFPSMSYQADKIAVESARTCDATAAPSLDGGALIEARTIDVDSSSALELVRTFRVAGGENYLFPTTGLTIDACDEGEWENIYRADAGSEAPESINIGTVDTTEGKALVVMKEYAGAGTSMDWDIVTIKNGKAMVTERGALLDTVLDARNYQFMGYNEVHVERNLVVETIPGYSDDAARCCPDLPSIKIFYQFSDDKLRVISTETVPGTPKQK